MHHNHLLLSLQRPHMPRQVSLKARPVGMTQARIQGGVKHLQGKGREEEACAGRLASLCTHSPRGQDTANTVWNFNMREKCPDEEGQHEGRGGKGSAPNTPG